MIANTATPVLVLGGKENSLSLARHLGRAGVTVRVCGPDNCWGRYSRHCAESIGIPSGTAMAAYLDTLLLGPASARLHGHILIACSDDAIEFVSRNHNALTKDYILGEFDPVMQLALLDKQRTLEMAREAGVGAPNFWTVTRETDLETIRADVMFPVMVKPIHSHRFAKVFGRKLFIIENSFDELKDKVALAHRNGLDVMVVEMVPGPDDLLSSYYTYVTASGASLFGFTKRILRRYPVNRGNACYHETQWLPETAAEGAKFFAACGFRGLGNIEFKRDLRDGKLKIIEVNARFTAAQELVARAGAPIDQIVYCHLTGQPAPAFSAYRQGLRFWYPLRDFCAFLALRKRGELSLLGWLKSVAPFNHVSPLFDWRDPLPALGAAWANAKRVVHGQG